ncbi:MAG TPA: hypothetical protein VIK18_20135 [Pirellulales bacterium]
MASSENQGLQFALIVFFILMVVLSVTTFIFFNSYQEADSRSKKDAQKAVESEKRLTDAQTELNKLKEFIGIKPEATQESAATDFKTDMDKFAAALPAEKRYYRQSLEETFNSRAKVSAELADAQDQIKKLNAVNAAYQKTANEQVAAATAAKDKSLAELKAEQAKFMEAQKVADGEKKDLADKLSKAQQEKTAEVEKVRKDVEQLQKAVASSKVLVKDLAGEKEKLLGKTYAMDDGEIRAVNQRTATVWLNLGKADGLRPLVTFTVHRAGLPATEEGHKASIEVTNILGDHLSEARILEDSLKDPIVPGDKVYTPLWEPGHPEHFAIVGRIDFNGGPDDLDGKRLRDLIRAHGGVIDAEVDPETAKVTGSVTVDTRYLIRGKRGSEKAQEAANSLVEAARQVGAEVISVDKLMDKIGWRDPNQIVRFGRDTNAGQYRPRDPDGGVKVSPGSTSDVFRRRRPGEPVNAYQFEKVPEKDKAQ